MLRKCFSLGSFLLIFSGAFAQSQICPANINFSLGALTDWGAYTGNNKNGNGASAIMKTYSPTVTYPTGTIGATIIPEYLITNTGIQANSVAATDIYGGFTTIPTINGYAYNYSIKLGSTNVTTNSGGSGGYIRGISYKISVPAGATTIPYTMTYAYAMVLENGSHADNEQPKFSATLVTATNDTIVCASPSYYLPTESDTTTTIVGGHPHTTITTTLDTASAYAEGFSASSTISPNSGNGYDVWAQGWKEVTFDLSPYRGQTVTLTFEADNCVPGKHFSYAYVAIKNVCSGLQITGDSSICDSVNLTYNVASMAGATYQWTVPAGWTIASGSGTNTISVSTGSTVGPVIVEEKNDCADLHDTLNVSTNNPSLIIHNPAAICSPGTVNITTTAVTMGSTLPAGTILSYYTDAAATHSLTIPTVITASGTYYIKAHAPGGCNDDIKPVVVTVNPTPLLTIHNPAAVCSPGTVDITNATITAGSTLPGGTTLSYYTDAAATHTLTNASSLSATGTYYIVGTAGAGCSDTTPVTITINPKPIVFTTPPAAVCSPAGVNLTATAVTAGSTTSLTYDYYTNSAATTTLSTPANVTTGGTYYIVGITAQGCNSDTASVIVTINATPSLIITNPAAVCSPATIDITNASVTAGSILPGSTTLSYYTDAAATNILSTPSAITASGTYYIKAQTTSGCSDVKPVTITINATPSLTITNPSAVCSPSTVDITNASVTVGSTLPGGTTLSYYTDTTATHSLTTSTSITASGTYYIKAQTTSGCSDVKPVAVIANAIPSLVITNPAAVCSPSTVDITANSITTGSTLPGGTTLSYYTDAATTHSLTTPTAITGSGTYYIKAQTTSGCSNTNPVTVIVNATPSLTITNPSAVCSPATIDITNASVTAGSILPGGTTLSYYTDAAATNVLSTPSAITASGTYYIKAQTTSSCSDVKPVTVTVNATPLLTITNPSAVCSAATINITSASVTAGSTLPSGTTLSYYTDAATTHILSTPSVITASGTYYIKAQTTSGCSDTSPVTVAINAMPLLVITNPAAVCSPATIDITTNTVTAGSTLPGGTTLNYYTDAAATHSLTTPTAITSTGTYYIKAQTTSGCSNTNPVTVTINATPSLTITNPSAVCSPSTIDITNASITAGSILPGGTTLSYYTDAAATHILSTSSAITASGTYYIKAQTTSGCSDVKPVTVTVNATPSLAITNPAAVCSPSTIDITNASVTAGSILPGGTTLSYYTDAAATHILSTPSAITASGTYYIKAQTTSGCSNTNPVTVIVNATPSLTITNPAAVCSPSTIDITANTITAGSTLPGGTTLSYYTDAAATHSITTPTAITSTGTYYIKAQTTSGCSDVKPVTVTANATPLLTITNPAAICSPSTIDITANTITAGSTLPGGTMLSYYTDAAATNSLAIPSAISASGTYYIKAQTTSGCSDTNPVTVNINATPSLVIINPAAVCSPATIDITTNTVTAGSTLPGGTTLSYYTDAAATNILSTPSAISASSTYYIKAQTTSGCNNIKPVTVTVNATPSLTIANPSAVCSPSTIDITNASVTAGSTLPGGTILSYYTDAAATQSITTPTAITISGTYYIKAQTTSGCSDVKPVTVTVNATPSLVITNPSAACSPAAIDITNASVTVGSTLPGGTILSYYTDAAATHSITIPTAITTSGTYYIKAQTTSGCSGLNPVIVTINATPSLTITNPSAVCSPSTIDITNASATAGSILPGSTTLSYYTDVAATNVLSTPSSITASGTYYIKAQTASGCSDIKPITVTINVKPSLIITNPAAVCSPSTIDITANSITTGSTLPGGTTLSYYTDAAATNVLSTPSSIIASGTYYIKAQTTSGCLDIKSVTVTINATPSLIITNPSAVCSPLAVDITANTITAGSTLPGGTILTYYTDAATTHSLTTPTAITASGIYYIKAQTTSGCSNTNPVTVTVNATPSLVITNPSAACSPSTIDITNALVTAGSTLPSGTTLSYYTDAAATHILSTPSAMAASGTYYIKAQTTSGCSDVKPVTVTVNATPSLAITNPAAVCSPSTIDITNTSVTAGSTLPGGTTLSYYTDTAATDSLANPTAITITGTYYIEAQTTSGCNDVKPVTVTVNATPLLVITNPSAVCSPSTIDITNASVTAGSTLPSGTTLTYYTDPAATNVLSTPSSITASGTYYIKAQATFGCSDVKPVMVIVNATPSLAITNPAAVCSPETINITNASVTSGSTLPTGTTLTYYTDAATTRSLTTPTAIAASGTYYIEAQTTSGCSNVKPVAVTVNAMPLLVITNPAAVCSPSTIDITNTSVTAGSTLPIGTTLSYFTDAAAINILSTPSAITASGTYYIKAQTTSGCNNIKPVTVTVNAIPSLVITNPSAVCSPATIDITNASVTAGSTLPTGTTLTYYTDAATTNVLSTPSLITVSGTYYIKAQATSGCSDVKPIMVIVNATPSLVIINPSAVCSPLAVDITANTITTGSTLPGGTTLTYYTDAAAINVLSTPSSITASGIYYIKAQATSGCSDVKPVTVTVNATPSLTITNPAAVCSPETINITNVSVTAGSALPSGTTLTYYTDAAATHSLTTPTAIAASGTYYIEAQTTSGCSDVKPAAITVNAMPLLVITNPAAVCSPATVDITNASVTAGSTLPIGTTLTYYTDAAATNVLSTPSSITASGIYYIKAQTTSGCSNVKPVTVTVNATPSLDITNPAAVCSPSTVDITNASITAGSILPGGTMLSYYTDAGITHILSTPSSITASDTYYIKAQTTSGCSDIKSVAAIINNLPILIVHDPAPVCSPGTVNITVPAITAGSILPAGSVLSYYMDAAATQVLPNPTSISISGIYYIKVQTTSGCYAIQAINVTINPTPSLTVHDPYPVFNPERVNISSQEIASIDSKIPAGSTFTYYTDSAMTNPMDNPGAVSVSGTYYVKVQTLAGCYQERAVIVTIYTVPTTIIHNPKAVCSPAAVDITDPSVTAGSILPTGTTFSYYTDASATIPLSNPSSVTTSGTYYIKIQTTIGYTAIEPVTVTVNPTPVSPTVTNQTICSQYSSQTALPMATPPAGTRVVWYDENHNVVNNPYQKGAGSTTYYAQSVSSAGCKSDSTPVTVSIVDAPKVYVDNPTVTIVAGTSGQLGGEVIPGSGGLTYQWSPAIAGTDSLDPTVSPTENTTYTLTATSTGLAGCNSSATVDVIVVDPISVPNIFSPNGDGTHDLWVIKNIEQYPKADIQIFNRYGQFLYESDGDYEDHPWDGKYNGKLVPIGAYYYIINLNADIPGGYKPYAGCISVIY